MTNVAKNKQLPAFLVLTIISLVAAIVLAVTNEVTKGPIAEHARKAREAAFQVVLPADTYDDPAEGSKVYVARKAGDKVDVISQSTMTSNGVIAALNQILPVAELPASAEPLTASAPGFVGNGMGGDVGVTVTLNEDGTIATLAVDVATQTPGIGDKCADEAWLAQFIGKKGPFSPDAGPVGYCVVASAQGYGGPVAVTLGVDMNGVVTGAQIGDTSFAETPGFGMKWKEDADRTEQFIGISLKEGGMIEGITGATVTSNAVLKAANEGLADVSAVMGIERTEPVLQMGKKEVAYADSVPAGEYTASKKGFASEVKVTFAVDENSTITALTIDSSGETPDYGGRCMSDASYVERFIGRKIPFTFDKNVDALAGATITSEAIVDAINSVAAADEAGADDAQQPDGTGSEEPSVEASADPAEAEAPAEEVPAAEPLTAYALGFNDFGMSGDVGVIVTLNEDGTIATLEFDLSKQMPPNCNLVDTDEFKAQFIGKKGPFEGIDTVATATMTSNGIIEALNSLFPAAEAPAEEAPVAEPLTAYALGFNDFGMSGDVGVIVTLNEDGTIATLEFDLSKQMPPNCNLVDTDEFKAQFIGKKGPFEGVDTVATATMTSNGIINALNSLFPAAEAPAEEVPAAEAEAPAEEAPAAEPLTAYALGFNDFGISGDVGVIVTLNEDGTIATLEFDLSKQMPPNCNLVDTDEFKAQFIGKKGPFEGVDTVATATMTSNGIINALNSLFPAAEAPAEEVPAAEAEAPAEDAPAADVPTQDMSVTGEEGPVAPNAATITVPAYQGKDVVVTVTFAEDGTVADLVIDASTQSPGLGMKCAEEGFVEQFIGNAAPFTLGGNVDAVSYATITSQAIVDAVNEAAAAE